MIPFSVPTPEVGAEKGSVCRGEWLRGDHSEAGGAFLDAFLSV